MLRPLLPTTSGRESFGEGVLIERTVTEARLDDRSTARCVRADVTAIPLVDSPVSSRNQALHLPYFEIPLPSSGDRLMSSQASARFWFSMTLFGPQRPLHFDFVPLRLVLVEKHVSLVCVQSQQQTVSPPEQYYCNKAVQLSQTAHAGGRGLAETDGTG